MRCYRKQFNGLQMKLKPNSNNMKHDDVWLSTTDSSKTLPVTTTTTTTTRGEVFISLCKCR
jgi:hypothetical protein